MLLRALFEISTNYYVSVKQLSIKDDFVPRIRKVAEHMRTDGLISEEQMEVIRKHSMNEGGMLHLTTLHKWVHSDSFHPNYLELTNMWDSTEFYFRECWNA